MADKTLKKVSLTIKRERPAGTRVIAMTGFKLRLDKTTGLLDVFFEVGGGGLKGERVTVDPSILASNLDSFKKFIAGQLAEPDESAQKEDVIVSERSYYANIVHCSNMGMRAETIFGVFSFHDWVESSRSEGAQKGPIPSFDSLVAFSTSAAQKKLLLEMLLLVEQLAKEQSLI